MAPMHLGLFGINVGAAADPAVMVAVARHAEAAGYESVWTGEHLVLPDPQAPPSPSAPECRSWTRPTHSPTWRP
ncbi:MAG: hypothetical protein R2710_27615 [Acidimicrobiales bacterium]